MDQSNKVTSIQAESLGSSSRYRPLVLFLESETCLLQAYQRMLKDAGYRFLGTSSEQEALRLLRTQRIELFGLNLTRPLNEVLGTNNEQEALRLQGTDPAGSVPDQLAASWLGRCQFVRQIKADKALSEIPLLVVSGFKKVKAMDMFQEAGVVLYRDLDGYLEKPFSPVDLVATIETILVRRGKLLRT